MKIIYKLLYFLLQWHQVLDAICWTTLLQFGDKEKVWQLKLLNGSVYVRFGASVMPLDEFLANNDPCRGWCYCYWWKL